MQTLSSLNKLHALPGVVSFQAGNGGLIKAVVTTPAASAEVYLNGAHVTGYQPAGQRPVLFVSGKSRFAAGKAIRGGVPICFPWFGPLEGNPTAPSHGFARTSEWTLLRAEQHADQSVTVQFELARDEDEASAWPHAFRATYAVTVGDTLTLSLTVAHVRGEPFLFEEALHSYFAVGNVDAVAVSGLQNNSYLDKTRQGAEDRQADAPLRFTGETDRVYLDTTAECAIDDSTLRRRIRVAKAGSNSTVVWNPWTAKAAALPDLGDDEWPGMLCIETCNVGRSAVRLGAGESHTMTATLRSEPM